MTDPLDPMVASAKLAGPGMRFDQDSVRLGLYFGDSTGRFGTELRLRGMGPKRDDPCLLVDNLAQME